MKTHLFALALALPFSLMAQTAEPVEKVVTQESSEQKEPDPTDAQENPKTDNKMKEIIGKLTGAQKERLEAIANDVAGVRKEISKMPELNTDQKLELMEGIMGQAMVGIVYALSPQADIDAAKEKSEETNPTPKPKP